MRKVISTVSATLVAISAAGLGAIVPAHAFVGVVDCATLKTDLAAASNNDVYTLHDAGGLCTNRIQGRAVDMGAAEVPVAIPTLPLAGSSSVLEPSVVAWLGGFGLVVVVLLAGGVTGFKRWGRRST